MRYGLVSILALACADHEVEQWGQFELSLIWLPAAGRNAFTDVDLSCTFSPFSLLGGTAQSTVTVGGFFDGGSTFRCRFSPHHTGDWIYTTTSNVRELDEHKGGFRAVSATGANHGPVLVDGNRLIFADGSPYFSVGTTSYQWSSICFDMQRQTLETLRNGQGDGPIFNKMRMTVFPKWYDFNHANPVQTGTAYEILPGSPADNATAWNCVGSHCPSMAGSFDLERFNVSYWQNYELLLREMQAMGVIADIIVFHPYDYNHWGFDCMGGRDKDSYNTTKDKLYLKYLTARLASFSNVWWSMSNEWDFCECKRKGVENDFGPSPTWDDLFVSLQANDPYRRMAAIHNGAILYNHGQPWITHISMQGSEERTPELRSKFGKPVLWDEVQYEGNIGSGWGALSGQEETDRFWWGASLGAYVGHSETVLHSDVVQDDNQPLWWAKGGTLIGKSPPRIKWFRSLWENSTGRPEFGVLSPSTESFGSSGSSVAHMLSDADSTFHSLHFLRPGEWTVPLRSAPAAAAQNGWEVRRLDYWSMTVRVESELPADAAAALIGCDALPCNIEIARVGTKTTYLV